MKDCCERLGIKPPKHRALSDANAAVALCRVLTYGRQLADVAKQIKDL